MDSGRPYGLFRGGRGGRGGRRGGRGRGGGRGGSGSSFLSILRGEDKDQKSGSAAGSYSTGATDSWRKEEKLLSLSDSRLRFYAKDGGGLRTDCSEASLSEDWRKRTPSDDNPRPQRRQKEDQEPDRRPFSDRERVNERSEHVPVMKRLRDLEGKEPNEVLMAFVSPRSGFLKMFQYAKIKDEQLELMVRLLEMACRSVHSPMSLSRLLQSINECGFIKGPLTDYLTSRFLRDGFSISNRSGISSEFLINVIEITKTLMHHLPSHSSGNVMHILSQLSSWLTRCSGDSEASVLKDCLAVAEQMRQDIVRAIRGGDVVRDQDIEDKEYEEPPDDFRKIPVMPTASEIKSDEPPFLRKNIIFGAYRTVDHYLDVQYRLLREDFVCPLREGLKMLLVSKEKNIPLKKLSDIRFYSKVQILTPYCTSKGIMYRARFDVTQFRRIRWESSKRLIFGSLVGLSKDNFENIIFGTVADRQPEELSKGIVDLFFEDESAYKLDPNPYTEYQMVECSAYFEAYRHVLQGLQEMQENGLPFKKYILNVSSDVKAVDPPRYLRGQEARYDFSCLLSEVSKSVRSLSARSSYRSIPVLDSKAWPSAEDLGLDDSQYHALQTAVTKEFVTIQGPPGTGKTFIGLKIVQLFLRNKECWLGVRANHSPILIVCYTNHALDQFLEGVFTLCELKPGDLVRIGGRSTSENKDLHRCSLLEIKRADKDTTLYDVQNAVREVRQQLEVLESQITYAAAQIEGARKFITHEMVLQRFMTHQQAGSLFRVAFPDVGSLLPVWLGFGSGAFLPGDMEDAEAERQDDSEEVLEDDQEEVKRMQEERMIDETLISSSKKHHLKQIKEMSEKCQGIVDISGYEDKGGERWENVPGSKRKKKQMMRQNLGFHNMMKEEEARRVNDVWRMNMKDRWRLYNFWVSKHCEELALIVRAKNVEFNRLSSHLAELNMEEDFAFLRRASVIGMTTTGAAKYRQLLQRVHPKIVIVEEAAEVMEAHVVTTLSHRCEHLILIGDHQQLRPNPTVYRLAKEFHLDISLFERMVKNDIHCDQLTIQHRMRPDIVKLIVPHVYKQLLNHESVLRYPDVKGIRGNVFFINHSFEESSVDDTRSRSNLHEANYLACLAKYLLQQGYTPQQITVLTTYTGQMFLLRKLMPKDKFEGMRITPVDNFQGEENDVILLSLVRSNEQGKIGFLQTHNRVCVALSRAKIGLYVIGNIEMMAEAGMLWNSILKDLKKDSRLVEALPLACQNHPESVIHAKLPQDFSQAPEGGCMLDCGCRLACGHVCQLKCHPRDKEHTEYLCMKPCLKILCDLGHKCPKLCHEKCPRCTVLVEKTIPSCQHKQMVMCHIRETEFQCGEPCQKTLWCGHLCQEKCGSECTKNCLNVVAAHAWPCGHFLTVECFRNPDNFPCNVNVDKALPCGHQTTLKCSSDVDKHRCTEEIDISFCADLDHVTKIQCHMRTKYLTKKCEKTVTVTCRHNSKHTFMLRCFEVDDPKCPFKCDAKLECGHACPGNCGICNGLENRHQSCRAPCQAKLMCGHTCKGICGQPCPPCGLECNLFCGHGQTKCKLRCGNVCNPCELPCNWNCQHENCTLACKEPCVRPPCNLKCPRQLQCRHPCIGLCGELCPPLCGVCNKPNLLQLMDYLKMENFSRKTRFLLLQPCGHVVEVDYMDKWVEDTKPKRPCEATFLACPICRQMVGFCRRYNNRIKNYMIEINLIKQASQKSRRFSLLSNEAVTSLWPGNSSMILDKLLGRSKGSKDSGMFQRLGLGALCVWQECQNVVQLCKKKNADIEKEVATLDEIRKKLIASVDKEEDKEIARCVDACRRLNLVLHSKRMLAFIKNPRLKSQLEVTVACLRTDVHDDSPTESKTLMLEFNRQMSTNFSAQQKEYIDNFLDHLNEFFQSSVRSELSIKRWMLCSNNHVFGVTDDSVASEKLEKQCFKCYPENSSSLDASLYRKNINTVIEELLGFEAVRLGSVKRVPGLRRVSPSSSDSEDSTVSEGEFEYRLYRMGIGGI